MTISLSLFASIDWAGGLEAEIMANFQMEMQNVRSREFELEQDNVITLIVQ